MNHLRALLLKFAMIIVVLSIVLGLVYRADFADIFWISLILTITAYVLGDLFVLPFAGNWVATLADLGLAFLGVWLLGAYLFALDIPLTGAAALSAVAVAAGEWFFHKYIRDRVLNEKAVA
ncbi:YndM family protein [Bacillaceae bacterium]